MDKLALLALHRHFLVADAVKQFLFIAVPVDPKTSKLPDDILEVAQGWSTMLRLQVFYALMYVVIEGYRELGCRDAAVDAYSLSRTLLKGSGASGLTSRVGRIQANFSLSFPSLA